MVIDIWKTQSSLWYLQNNEKAIYSDIQQKQSIQKVTWKKKMGIKFGSEKKKEE